MAINKFMMAALKALSYADIDVKNNYRVDRLIDNITHRSSINNRLFYEIWDHKITVEGHDVPVRIFTPPKIISKEVILYFHGGGWVTGNIENYTNICAALAKCTGRRVLSADYRLAPEHPFPAAITDCYGVVRDLFLNRNLLKLNADDIILMGDSAGGNLAAVVSLIAHDYGEFDVKKQILLYPATFSDHTENSPFESILTLGKDYLLTTKRICDYIDLYVQDSKYLSSPYFAPILSDNLFGQPKTLIITAEYDPLRDEGEAYGEKLKSFGNYVEIHRISNALHGFFSLPTRFTQVKKCYNYINSFLNLENKENKN